MIKFTKLTVEGFGSLIEKKEFPLDMPGLNIIRGKVGSGKTSIPSVMYWVIYGTSLKKGSTIETWEELRTDKFKGTFGKLDFKIGSDKYSIIRCIQYKGVVFEKQKGGSKILVIKNGVEQKSEEKGKRGIQAFIESIIGYSPELFINSIIYGQRLKRIIEESGPNKKKIFDEAFETMFIDKAKSKASDNYKELNTLHSKLTNDLDNLCLQLKDNMDSLDTLIGVEVNFERDKKDKIKELRIDLANIDIEISKDKAKLATYAKLGHKSDLSKSVDALITLKQQTKDHIIIYQDTYNNYSEVKRELENLKADKLKLKNNKCPSCGGILKDNTLIKSNNKAIEEGIKKRDNLKIRLDRLNIKTLKKELEKTQKRLDSSKEKLQEIISSEKAKSILEANLINYEKRRDKIKKKLKEIRASSIEIKSDKYKEKIAKQEEQLEVLTKEIKEVDKSKELVNWLIKEPLSNSGIKAYIFDSLLSKVNNNLTNYSEILGFRVEFGIDMETAAKDFYQVIYKDDILINYPDLSGGQKQLVDTAVALAIHDVISSVKPINILFLDEPFEGLDADTIEIVSDIISYKAINRSLFLITHHPSFNPTNSNTIYFSLDKNGNTIID